MKPTVLCNRSLARVLYQGPPVNRRKPLIVRVIKRLRRFLSSLKSKP